MSKKEKEFYEYDSSSDEYSIDSAAIVKKFNKGNINEVDKNKMLHFVGSKIYHSQDKAYYYEKRSKIKPIRSNLDKSTALFKTIFRQDDSDTIDFNYLKEFLVYNINDLIKQQRLLDKSLKVELKNFANPLDPINTPQIFSTSFRFQNFSTHVENHKLAASISKGKEGEFYRQPHIPVLTGYDSDNESSDTIKKHWKDIDFSIMNKHLKQTLKTGVIGKDTDKGNKEFIKEIISLLFITETSRNSATYLITPMFLELLGRGEISLKKTKIADNFPMAMKNAVSAIRALNAEYYEDLKSQYDYREGYIPDGRTLRENENKLFDKWLKFKQINLQETGQIVQAMEQLITEWYGIKVTLNADDKVAKNSVDSIMNTLSLGDGSSKLLKKTQLTSLNQSSSALKAAKELIEESARGDDRNLEEHGSNDPYYWYSITDGLMLLSWIRKNYLDYNNKYTHSSSEQYTAHIENNNKVLVTDPYYQGNLSDYFQDDILRITEGKFGDSTCQDKIWSSMPTTIIIPLLSGIHWRAIVVTVNYKEQTTSILLNDPYGKGQFTNDLVNNIIEMVRTNVEKLIQKEINDSTFKLEKNKIKIKEKVSDQQGKGQNGWDCGPITFSNIKDYLKYYTEKSPELHYSIPPYDSRDDSVVRKIKVSDIKHYCEMEGRPLNQEKIEVIKEQLQKSREKNKEIIKITNQDINLEELTPIQIDMLFKVLENARLLGIGNSKGGYTKKEIADAYTQVLLENEYNKQLSIIREKLKSKCSDDVIDSIYHIGNCYYHLDKSQIAADIYKLLLLQPKLNDKASIHHSHALALKAMNKMDEAIKEFYNSIDQNTLRWDSCHYKGVLLFNKNEYEKAVKYFNKAIREEPNSLFSYCYKLQVLEKLEAIYTKLGDEKSVNLINFQINECFKRATSLKQMIENSNYHKKGLTLYHIDEYKAGLKRFSNFIKDKLKVSDEAYNHLISENKINDANCLLLRDKHNETIEILDKSVNEVHDSLELYNTGLNLYNSRQYTEALKYFNKRIENNYYSGSGTNFKSEIYQLPYHQSLNEYYSNNIEQILKLRIKDLDLADNIKILPAKYQLSQNKTNLDQMLEELSALNLKNQDKVLIPYNIEGRHWVGLMITKDNDELQVNYMDTENKPIPAQLLVTLKSKAKELELPSKISQIITEEQQFNNCGPEVIENFILQLTGGRVIPQEDVVPFHSQLIEKSLLGGGSEWYE